MNTEELAQIVGTYLNDRDDVADAYTEPMVPGTWPMNFGAFLVTVETPRDGIYLIEIRQRRT